MRLSLLLLATILGTTSAFISAPIKSTVPFGIIRLSASDAKSSDLGTSDFAAEAADDASKSGYERIGFTEATVGMGVDPVEVLQWLGTRDDLISRFIKDNKGLEKEKAEEEVDKFMMDTLMVNKFIAYEQKKADPDFIRNSLDENLSDPQTLGIYAAWIIAGVGIAVAKNLFIEPKFQSGEWKEIHINLDSFIKTGGGKAAEETVGVVGDAVVSSVDTISNAVGDIVSQIS